MQDEGPEHPGGIRDVWVRCCDGALYRDPLFVFREGYIRFDEFGNGNLVIWRRPDGEWVDPSLNLVLLLKRAFGDPPNHRGAPDRVGTTGIRWRENAAMHIPRSNHQAMATRYTFPVFARIPRPQIHGEIERYTSRLPFDAVRCDWPQSPFDASQIEFGLE